MITLGHSIAEKIEKWADETFSKVELPHPIRDVSLWQFLTLSEDISRMHFNGEIEISPEELDLRIDRFKYALKHGIDRICKHSKISLNFPIPQKTIPESYIKSHALLTSAMDYAQMVQIFSSIHCGHSSITENEGKNQIEHHKNMTPDTLP